MDDDAMMLCCLRSFAPIPSLSPQQHTTHESFLSPPQKQHSIYGEGDFSAFLIVELPVFDVPVMHEETFYPTPQHGPSGSLTPLDLALFKQKKTSSDVKAAPSFHPLDAVPFLDYENENDNPVEDKYRTLAHDLLRGLVDPALKPDREQRDRLAAIIASPSHHPSRAEKGMQGQQWRDLLLLLKLSTPQILFSSLLQTYCGNSALVLLTIGAH